MGTKNSTEKMVYWSCASRQGEEKTVSNQEGLTRDMKSNRVSLQSTPRHNRRVVAVKPPRFRAPADVVVLATPDDTLLDALGLLFADPRVVAALAGRTPGAVRELDIAVPIGKPVAGLARVPKDASRCGRLTN